MGSNWLFGSGLDVATAWTEFGLAWLVQSTAIVILGMLAAALVRRRHPAVLSVVYQTTLVAVLAAPLVAYALASAGLTFVSLALPEARYESQELVEVLVAAEEPPVEVAATAPTPSPSFDNLDRLEDEIQETSNPSSEPTFSIDGGLPVEQPSFGPSHSPQPEVAVSPPAPSVPPAPAEPIVRRVLQRVTRTHWLLAAIWFAIPAVWLVGSSFLVLRLVIDHARLQHLRRSAEHADAITIGIGLETARRMNVPLPELLRSPLVASPCLCGLVRPAILLPEELDADALPAVLVHELAHRKRGDLLWNLLRHIAASLLWPQPLIWQLSRRLEAVAEDVCDDYVVALGGCRHSYAAALVAIAQRDLMPSEAAVSLVTFRSMLGQRVQRILDGSRGLSLTVGLAALVVIATGGATAVLMAGLLGPGRSGSVTVVERNKNDEAQGGEKAEAKELTDGMAADRKTVDDDVVIVRGVVLDPEGKPAAGTRVVAVAYQRESNVHWTDSMPPVISETRSQADGSYEISFRKSHCEKNVDGMDQWHFTTIAALHKNYAPAFNDYNLFEDPQAATLRLVEDQPVQGRIVNLEGQPIAGATVRLRGVGRNDKEDISRWVAAMRDGVKYFNGRPFDPPHHASSTLRFLNPEPVTTDAEGRFTLRGLGKNRHAILRLTGPGIALADLNVVTMPIENFTVESGNSDSNRPTVYHGSSFQFAAPPSQLVSGIVRDAGTKQPIAGARVILDMLAGNRLTGIRATETTTNAEGRYELTGMPRGEGNQLLVIPPADQPYFMREFEDVPISEDFSPVTFDMELQRGIWITGRVTTKDSGKPLDGRMYYLPWPDNPHIEGREQWHDNGLHGPQTNYLTDREGRYRLVGLPGRGLVAAWCVRYPFPQGQGVREISDLPKRDVYHDIVGSFAPTEQFPTIVKEIHPAEDATEFEVDVAIDTGKTLDVHFVDAAGWPVQDLTIQGLYPKATSSLDRPEKYGSDVTVLGLKPDEKRLLIVHSEAARLGKAIHVQLADAKDGRMTVTLEPTITVVGRLLDGAGDPLNTAQVTARPSSEENHALRLPSTHTDADGRFSLTLFAGCQYDISHTEPSFELASIADELPVSPGETIDLGEFDVTSKERPEPKRTAMAVASSVAAPNEPATKDDVIVVRGVVLDPEGQPVAGARVNVLRYYWHGQRSDTPLATSSTNAQGEYVISYRKTQFAKNLARPEMWREAAVVVTYDGYGPGWTSYGDIQDGGSTTLRLVDDQPVEGRIVDLEGRPIAGVTVELESIYRHTQEDIARWVDAMRRGVPFFGSEDYGRPNDSVPGFGLPIAGTLVTGQDGRFSLRGIGKNRYAFLKIRSAQCAAAELRVVTMPIESFEADFGQSGYKNLLTFYGAKFSFSAEPSQPIEGIVRDAITKQPLPGVRVYADQLAGKTIGGLYAAEAVSDAEGRYRLLGLPKGEGNGLLAVPNDEQPYFMREFRDIPMADGLAPIQYDIELHRGIWITGRLSETVNGAPVQAHLYYLPWPDNEAIKDLPEFNAGHLPGSHMRYESDADGRFRLVGLPGRGLVAANTLASFPFGQGVRAIKDLPPYDVFRKVAGVYAPTSTFPTAVYEIRPEGETDVEIDFRIVPGSRIPVRFVDAAGEPASGLRVHGLQPKSKWHEDKNVGPEATLLAFGSDETRLLLAHDEARSQGKAVLITPDRAKEKTLQIELEPCAKVKARLLDVDGQPMPGLVIRIWPVGEQDWIVELPSASTDDNGNVEAQLLPGVAYSIYAESAQISMQPLIKDLQIGAGETIDLGEFDVTSKERPEPKRTAMAVASSVAGANDPATNDDVIVVRGVVLDPDGQPVAGAKLQAYAVDPRRMWGDTTDIWREATSPEFTTDSAGEFRVELYKSARELASWPKTFPVALVVATSPGRGPAWSQMVRKDLDQPLSLRLVDDQPITAHLVDLEGQPIAGASVVVQSLETTADENPTPWLDALRSGRSFHEAEAARGAKKQLGFVSRWGLEVVPFLDIRGTTDADGRVQLSGIGRGRLANLYISGPGVVTVRAKAIALPIEMIEVNSPLPSYPTQQNIQGAEFTLSLENSTPIEGVVRDAETGNPLAGVRVVSNRYAGLNVSGIHMLSTVSDAAGHYRLDGMPSGEGNNILGIPNASQPYFLREFDVPEGHPVEVVNLDLKLHRGVFIEGVVRDAETKDPVHGQLYYLPWPDHPRLEDLPELTRGSLSGPQDHYHTDAQGHYRIVGLPGRGVVLLHRAMNVGSPKAYPNGQGLDAIADLPADEKFRRISNTFSPRSSFITAVKEVNATEQGDAGANIELREGERISLRLVDAEGQPVSGVRIRGLSPPGQFYDFEGLGPEVEVAGLAAGESRRLVIEHAERRLGKSLDVSVASHGHGPVEVALDPCATVKGRVLDYGVPVAGATIMMYYRAAPNYVEQIQFTTDAEGAFSHDAVPPGVEFNVQCHRNLLKPSGTKSLADKLTAASGETIDLGEVDIAVDKRPEPRRTAMVAAVANAGSQPTDSAQPLIVRGVVLDPDGKPIVGAKVKMIRDYSTNKWAKDAPKVEVVSGAEGRFEFDVPKLLSDGYRNGQPWPVSGVMVIAEGAADTFVHLRDDSAAANATIRMTPFAPLEGRIVNLEGQPVPGVTVQLHQVNVTESGDLGPYLAALRAGTPADEIDDATKPSMGFGHEAMRTANRATTDADGRFRLERVGRNHIALLRLSGGGIVLTEIQVANVATEPVPFGDNSRQATEDMLYGSPFEFAVEPSPPIVGIVTDAETLKPIAGATIGSTRFEEINKYGFGILETKTDELGRYRLEGVRPKPSRGELQRFVVRSTGDVPYLPQEFDAPEAGEDLAPIVYGIELHRGVWIEGRVTDAVTGKPISAKVEYLPWYDNPRVDHLPEYQGNGTIRLDGTTTANTDADGRFKLIGIAGRGIVQIANVTEDDYPMGQGFEAIPELPADAEKFKRLGHWNIPRPEYNVAIKELNVADDAKRAEVEFRLQPGKKVAISTIDQAGKPIEVTQAFGLHPHHILRTHENPSDKIEVLGLTEREPRTIVLLNIERRLGAAVEINLKEDSAPDRSVTLLPLAAITGRLVDASGEPLPAEDFERDREYIKLWSETHGRSMQVHATTPNEKGEFELLAAAGPIEYRVYAPNARGDLAEKLRVEPGETIDLGTIDGTKRNRPPVTPKRTKAASAVSAKSAAASSARGTLELAGTVVGPDGQPVGGAKLHVLYYTPNAVETKPRTTSGADGSFSFSMQTSEFDTGESNTPWTGARVFAVAPGLGAGWVALPGVERSGEMLKEIQARPNYVATPEIISLESTIRLVADEVPLEGRLLSLEGQPIVGARVQVIELHGNPRSSLDAWIEAAEKPHADLYQVNRHLQGGFAGLHLRQQVAQLFPTATTDADGRFRIAGVGRERIAMLRIEGDGIETRQVNVRTREGKTYELLQSMRDPDLGTLAYHGATFELAVGPSRDVVGTVLDEQSGEPLSGVTVVSDKLAGQTISGGYFNSVSAVTDAKGEYRLRGLPVGENRIVAVPPKGQPHLAIGHTANVQLDSEPTADFKLPRGIWIRGRVTDSKSGEPVRAWVEYFAFRDNPASNKLDSRSGEESTRGTTDAEGRFELRGVTGPGMVGVRVMNSSSYPLGVGAEQITQGRDSDSGIIFTGDNGKTVVYRTTPSTCISNNFQWLKEIAPAEDDKDFTVDFVLVPGATAKGIVLDPDGKPLTGAKLADNRAFNSFSPAGLKTAEFEIPNFTAGEQRRVSFFHAERQLAGSRLLTGDETSPIEVKLAPCGAVTGRVLMASGEPAENVDLAVILFGGRSEGTIWGKVPHESSLRTDAEGRFHLEGLAPDTPYALSAQQGRMSLGTVAEKFTVVAGEKKDLGDLTIRPVDLSAAKSTPKPLGNAAASVAKPNSATVTFTGTVLGPDGKPQAGANVSLPYRVNKEKKVARVTTAADGTFKLEVPRKDFTFEKHSFTTILVEAEGLGIAWDYAAPFEVTGEMIAALPEHHRYAEFVTKSKMRTLKLVDDHAVAGRIVNLEGQPIAGAKVVVNAVHANHAEGLGPWLASVQNHELGFQQAWRKLPDMFHPSSNDEDGTSPFGPVLTDADGRFRFAGLGRDRLVSVNVSGPGIETRELYFRTQPGEVLELADNASQADGEVQTVYASEFQNAAAPSLPLVGTVRDADTSQPLAGVEITPESIAGVNLGGRPYRSMKAITDAEGRYRLEGLPIGENDIAAVPADDQPYPPVSLEVEMDSTKPETTLDFQLKRGVWIRGRVTDGDTGEPVVSRVQYLPFSDNDHVRTVPGLYRSIDWKRTEDDGSFQIIGLPGHGLLTQMVGNNYEKYPRGGGHEKVTGAKMGEHVKTFPYLSTPTNCHYMAELNVDAAATEVRHDMKLFAGGTRSGLVVDPQGQALAGAHCVGLKSAGFWDELPTNEFAVNHLKAGEKRRLTFFHEERNLAASIEISSDESTPVTVTLQPAGTVTGLIRFESGDLASRVELSGDRRSASPGLPLGPLPPCHPRLTSDDGRFTLKGLVPGLNYSVHASRSSYIIGNVFKDATVAAGETKDLGELTIPDPQN